MLHMCVIVCVCVVCVCVCIHVYVIVTCMICVCIWYMCVRVCLLCACMRIHVYVSMYMCTRSTCVYSLIQCSCYIGHDVICASSMQDRCSGYIACVCVF